MPDTRIDNLAVARKVRFRYTGGAYGCASGRGMGLSLEHDGRRRGYALSLTAGLLWGVGLVKLALSMSFSTVSFQLDGYSSLGMLVGFGGSLALFVPLSVQKPELFSKPSAVIAFGALFIAGELLFCFPRWHRFSNGRRSPSPRPSMRWRTCSFSAALRQGSFPWIRKHSLAVFSLRRSWPRQCLPWHHICPFPRCKCFSSPLRLRRLSFTACS